MTPAYILIGLWGRPAPLLLNPLYEDGLTQPSPRGSPPQHIRRVVCNSSHHALLRTKASHMGSSPAWASKEALVSSLTKERSQASLTVKADVQSLGRRVWRTTDPGEVARVTYRGGNLGIYGRDSRRKQISFCQRGKADPLH